MLKVAAYLDEAHDTPEEAIKILAKAKINYVALRSLNNRNVGSVDEVYLSKLRQLLTNNYISTILIYTDVGVNQPLYQHNESDIIRSLSVASYFRSPFVHFGIGNIKIDGITSVSAWIDKVTTNCAKFNITPVYEYHGSQDSRLTEYVVNLFKNNKAWKMIYDPSYLVDKHAVDPYEKYWSQMKEYVAIVDIHDYKTGVGHKPLGYGDCRLSDTLIDIKNNKKDCWIIIEPKLGHRHSNAMTKSETFLMAFKRLQEELT